MRCSVLLLLAALSACVDTSAGPGLTGRVRLVNVMVDDSQLPVDVYLDGEAFGKSLVFGASTPAVLPPPATAIYRTLPWGGHNFTLRQSADSDVVVSQYAFAIEATGDITFYATGIGGFTGFQTFDDNRDAPAGSVRLRVVNLSAFAGAIDVFVTAQGADLAAATPNMIDVFTNSPSEYFSVPGGTWQFRAVRAATAAADRATNVVLNLSSQNWPGGGRTIVLADASNFLFARGVVVTDQ
ncbi:MAG: DUF4397 domain-containing protein [Gemmatimonadaceae bacterium]